MGTLILTSDFPGNKVEIRKDLIIGLEDLRELGIMGSNRTRVHVKGGVHKDVFEEIAIIKNLINGGLV